MEKELILNEDELIKFHFTMCKETREEIWDYFNKPLKYPCIISYDKTLFVSSRYSFHYLYVYLDDFEIKENNDCFNCNFGDMIDSRDCDKCDDNFSQWRKK
jgi:hypothetical protein